MPASQRQGGTLSVLFCIFPLARTGLGLEESLKYLLNEHRMVCVEESSYPDILLELSLSLSLGGLLKGSPEDPKKT